MLLVIVALLSVWSPLVFAHPLSGVASPTSPSEPPHSLDIFTRIRNGINRLTLGPWPIVPGPPQPSIASSDSRPKSSHTFKERYDRDLVLRFNISTEEEATSLAEAVDTLFLDVWDSTPVSADIRLAKDVVRLRSPRQAQLLTQLGPFSPGSVAEVYATRAQTPHAGPFSSGLRVPAIVRRHQHSLSATRTRVLSFFQAIYNQRYGRREHFFQQLSATLCYGTVDAPDAVDVFNTRTINQHWDYIRRT